MFLFLRNYGDEINSCTAGAWAGETSWLTFNILSRLLQKDVQGGCSCVKC